jgi:hypothetical protein
MKSNGDEAADAAQGSFATARSMIQALLEKLRGILMGASAACRETHQLDLGLSYRNISIASGFMITT